MSCELFESKDKDEKEEVVLDEEDLKAIITFNEWLYRHGNPPRLKYYIEKETKGNIRLQSVITMYSEDELVGINSFSVTLNSPINIDYFVISPDKNLPVDRIELKDVYIGDVKYSISKTFHVQPEGTSQPPSTDPPPDDPNDPNDPPPDDPNDPNDPPPGTNASCDGTPGARYRL